MLSEACLGGISRDSNNLNIWRDDEDEFFQIDINTTSEQEYKCRTSLDAFEAPPIQSGDCVEII